MRRTFAFACTLALAASALLAALPASARDARGPVELTLVDRDEGVELPRYPARGQLWVPGTPGHRYAVLLENRSAGRVLVVLSVDGVNAVTGESADFDQAGYVLEPWQSTEVTGWRKSLRDVAQFVFTDSRDSYASRTGRPFDVGVVGIAVFEEARWRRAPGTGGRDRDGHDHPWPEADARAEAASPASAPPMAAARAQSIGTGHGHREYDPVTRTGFVRASRAPVQVLQLRYEDGRALAARGIVPRRYGDRRRDPRAFPGGFVPDPPRR